MEFKDVAVAILEGKFDADLEKFQLIVKERRESKARATFYTLATGDKVRFVSTVKPRYLAGQVGTIRELRQKKVTVDLDNPVPGFQRGIVTPVSLIEKVA
jgi:hypothetical protein